ncbi:MAG TPA: TauD/TfdA family dioxygenase [Acidimicrobiales bacterium]|nr:TauD/TfdA family dioxygenase [Acidimicrobiales bacterium]
MTLETKQLTDTVGAEVLGVTVEELLEEPDVPQQVLDALEANGVLVFRELHLDDAQQVAFSTRLGRCEILPRATGEHPEIFRVSLDPAKTPSAEYLKGTFVWHIDGMTEDIPIMATILSAHAVADEGGETEFASTYTAYDDLSDEEKERFESVRVIHTFEAAQRTHKPNPTPEELEWWRKRPSKVHPLIWTHDSGRKSLVLGATTEGVEGMEPGEGRAFLDELLDRATRADRVYRHEWSVGDLVIWDNTGVLHRACPYDPTSPRDMHRTTLHGYEPVK